MVYRILADAVMTFHLLFLGFVVLGGFLAWRAPKLWFAHAAAALYGFATIVFNLICPLTPIEDDLRERAGQDGLGSDGFIATYIDGVIYPGDQIALARWTAFALVLISWVGLAVVLRRRKRRAREAAATPASAAGRG